MSSKLAINIKYFRDQQQWTQLQLANKLNVSRSVIAKWENEVADPDLSSLIKMCDLFSVSLDQLVGNNITNESIIKEFQRVYLFEQDHDHQELIQIIDFFVKNKTFMREFIKLSNMPLRKQKAILHIMQKTITEIKKL
ncbi:helix-turn-helix domain-containing protein [Bacillaceae bacterium W0354]